MWVSASAKREKTLQGAKGAEIGLHLHLINSTLQDAGDVRMGHKVARCKVGQALQVCMTQNTSF